VLPSRGALPPVRETARSPELDPPRVRCPPSFARRGASIVGNDAGADAEPDEPLDPPELLEPPELPPELELPLDEPLSPPRGVELPVVFPLEVRSCAAASEIPLRAKARAKVPIDVRFISPSSPARSRAP